MLRKQSRTCIAAIRSRSGKIIMAGDRRVSWDFSQAQTMSRPKINKRGGVILGGTGDGFLCSLIIDIMDIPEVTENLDDYIFNKFRRSITKIIKENGMVTEHGQLKIPSEMDAEIVIAISGKLYQAIISNPDPEKEASSGLISLDEVSLPYATGCGGKVAWGSLLTQQRIDKYPKREHLKIALEIAAEVSPGCNAVIDVMSE